MGSTGSRPRLRKVAPCNSLQEEGAQLKPQWTLPALPVTVEQAAEFLGQKKTILPPLRQEITLSTLSVLACVCCVRPMLCRKHPTKASFTPIHRKDPRHAIIISPQTLQPLALQIGHTSTANQIAVGRDYRDGGVHLFSTIGLTGHSGSGTMIQGGFLEAQTAHRHRRVHVRHAREQRRHKVVYSVNEGIQRRKLVRRPTERDIFWDETTGESLDPSCLRDPISLPRLFEERQLNQLLCGGEDGIQTEHAQCPRNREERQSSDKRLIKEN